MILLWVGIVALCIGIASMISVYISKSREHEDKAQNILIAGIITFCIFIIPLINYSDEKSQIQAYTKDKAIIYDLLKKEDLNIQTISWINDKVEAWNKDITNCREWKANAFIGIYFSEKKSYLETIDINAIKNPNLKVRAGN